MIISIDHVVLTTQDLEKTIFFYSNILEMSLKKQYFKEDSSIRYSLHFGNQKINIHEINKTFQPHAKTVLPGTLDLCFISEKKIDYWKERLKKFNIKIVEGPVKRAGAVKNLMSIYVRDPDLNLVEISNYIDKDA